MDWLQKTNLPLNDKWIGDLLQHKRNQNDLKSIVTISDQCTYSNAKALVCHAGGKGGVYPEFTNVSPREIKSFLGLYMLNGLKPLPQMKMALKSQVKGPIIFFLPIPYAFHFLSNVNRVSMEASISKRGAPPLHARVSFLFDQVPSKNMVMGLDNLNCWKRRRKRMNKQQ